MASSLTTVSLINELIHPYFKVTIVLDLCLVCSLGVRYFHLCVHDYILELGQYTSISIYRNTDNHNIISIHPITVSLYRNIVIYCSISTYLEGINVKAHLKSTTCLFAISNDV